MVTEQEAASLSVLKRVPIFSSLSEQEFAFLTSRLVQRKYGDGELIFGEGDTCAGLYVVQSGNVRIFKSSAGGREQVLSIDGPGSSIAELPVFDGGNYPARPRRSATARFSSSAARIFRLSVCSIPRLHSKFCEWSAPACVGL